MKKYLLSFFIVVSMCEARAQWVGIPDTNFAAYLNQHYPQCMNGNLMDTTCTAITSDTIIDVYSSSIHDLTGMSYFDNLKELYCTDNQLTFLPPLPKTVTILYCHNNLLTSLPELPDTLSFLFCFNNPFLKCFPRLKKIDYFSFYNTGITCLPNYPDNMSSNPANLYAIPLCDATNSNGCPYCRAFFSIYPDTLNQGVYYGFNQSYASNLTYYLWDFGDGNTSTLQYPSHTYTQPGQYYVCLTASSSDCANTYCDSSFYVFKTEGGLMSQLNILAPTGITEISTPQFFISPNPATTSVTISIDENMVGSTATISDITGRKMIAAQLITDHQTLITDFASGVYFVTLHTTDGRSVTKKLVVSR